MKFRIGIWCLAGFGLTLQATTLDLTGGAWYSLDLGSVNGDGIPYMDHHSSGPEQSLLELLPPGTYQYYGNASNADAAPESITFTSSVDAIKFHMTAKLTAFMDFNAMWLHPVGNPSQRTDIWLGSDRPGAMKTIQVPAAFVLCMDSGAGFTTCSDTTDGGLQRWAFVRDVSDGSIYFGAEDLTDLDRNEPVSHMSPIPEPGTVVMTFLGFALFTIPVIRRKRST